MESPSKNRLFTGGGNPFASVVLRKTVVCQDSSAPQLTGFVSESDVSKYQRDVLDINIEEWLVPLSGLTFATQLHVLSPADCEFFEQCYICTEEEKKELSPELLAYKSRFEKELEVAISQVRGAASSVFVKTSCRSAKDTGLYDLSFRVLFRAFLSEIPGPHTENDGICALLQAGLECMKTKSASHLLDSLCRSERVFQDMRLARQHMDRFQQHLAIREWVDIDVDLEFRGFVCGGQLTALSQYNHLCFFPRLVRLLPMLERKIQAFYSEHVHHRLESKGWAGFVVDFAITPTSACASSSERATAIEAGDVRVWVIELNPFLPTTDGCLFSWEKERAQLEKGPFEFRVRTAEARGAKSLLAMAWREVLEQELHTPKR